MLKLTPACGIISYSILKKKNNRVKKLFWGQSGKFAYKLASRWHYWNVYFYGVAMALWLNGRMFLFSEVS